MTTVTEPGVHHMPVDVYLADPVEGGSLSQSGAKKLLPPSCPARYRYDTDHPPIPTPEFDLGHAAHKLILGIGPEFVIVDADNWRTKAAREERDNAHALGMVPLLVAEHEQVTAMAAALREHPVAAALFKPGTGEPEQALFWRDQPSEIWRRALLDWLPEQTGGRMIVPDYKTCRSADVDALAKAMHSYGYHQQAAWYLDGVEALGLSDSASFVLVCQEKTPPYLITAVEPDVGALRVGRVLNRRAIDVYVECTRTGRWLGYTDDVELVSLPPWAENRYLEDVA